MVLSRGVGDQLSNASARRGTLLTQKPAKVLPVRPLGRQPVVTLGAAVAARQVSVTALVAADANVAVAPCVGTHGEAREEVPAHEVARPA